MEKRTIQYLDTLRALATFGVIVIHVSTPALKMNFSKNADYFFIANLIDSMVRCIVPVFLMLTGATMLGRNYGSVSEFYRKRIQRVLVPFVFWMFLYWVYFWIKLPIKKQPHDFAGIVQWALNLLYEGGISKHFWYFYMILAVYFAIPYMARLVQRLNRSTLLVGLLVWAVICYLLRDIPVNMYSWKLTDLPGKLLGWTLHSGYIVLGYYVFTLAPFTRKHRLFALSVYGLTIVVCAVLTWYFSRKTGKLDLSIYGYIKPNTIVQSIAFFLMLKDMEFRNPILLFIQEKVCRHSYGIYLAHVMALSLFFDYGFYWKIGNPLWSVWFVSVCALVLCYLFVFLLHKLPYGKYVSG